jgi:hypothetical protein
VYTLARRARGSSVHPVGARGPAGDSWRIDRTIEETTMQALTISRTSTHHIGRERQGVTSTALAGAAGLAAAVLMLLGLLPAFAGAGSATIPASGPAPLPAPGPVIVSND